MDEPIDVDITSQRLQGSILDSFFATAVILEGELSAKSKKCLLNPNDKAF